MRSQASLVMALAVASSARAQVGPVPAAQPVPGVAGMCFVPGWEYASRWSIPGNGYNSESQATCAAECLADPACTGATWIEFNIPEEQKNCWFKEWPNNPGLPCEPPQFSFKTYDALIQADDCGAIAYANLDEPGAPFLCDDEMQITELPANVATGGGAVATAPVGDAPAAVPTADAMAPMTPAMGPVADAMPLAEGVPDAAALAMLSTPVEAIADKDYIGDPMEAPANGPAVMDLPNGGSAQATATDCAQECIDTEGCNLASWYGADPTWTLSSNCWLKTVATPCVEPVGAVATPNVYLLVLMDPCDPVMGLAPNTGPPAAVAAAPPPMAGAVPPASGTPPLVTGTGADASAPGAVAPGMVPAEDGAGVPAGSGPVTDDFGTVAPTPDPVLETGDRAFDPVAETDGTASTLTPPGDSGAAGLLGSAVAAVAILSAALLA